MCRPPSIPTHRSCLALVLLALGTVLGAMPSRALDVPSPPDGAWVTSTIALLRYSHERCDRISGRIVGYWRSLPTEASSSNANLRAVRERILKDWLAELTEARTATDIAQTFLPSALEALDSESSEVLARLLELQTELCDQAAYPTGELPAYMDRHTDLLLQIDTQLRALDQLVPTAPATLDRGIEPYLEALQLAGVEAEGEMLHFLERPNRVDDGGVPAFESVFTSWYERYRTATTPTKNALASYLTARLKGDRGTMRNACSTLVETTIAVLDDDPILASPHDQLQRPLRRAFVDLKRMAAACLSGNFKRADRMLSSAEHQLAVAAAYFEPYGLLP